MLLRRFVKDNPGDFNGWTYLLQHVENVDVLDEIRTAYNAFLPLYPYCFAYWIRYSDLESKHDHWQRSLAILHRGETVGLVGSVGSV
jgi:pre-mRNA-processing factor 39